MQTNIRSEGEVLSEVDHEHKLDARIKQLESKLMIIDSENSRLVVTVKEKEETLEFMQNKCNTLEDTIKAERRKSKKERQKASRNDTKEQETDIKLEPKEEDIEEVVPEVLTSNKFDMLGNTSDQAVTESR